MPIGERLKEARLLCGLSQKELADKVGVSQGAIGNYETNAASPRESVLLRLMDILHVDANYLYQDYIGVTGKRALVSCEEEELLSAWRSATPEAQRFALQMLKSNPSSAEESPRHA